jgi:hypothetical protein
MNKRCLLLLVGLVLALAAGMAQASTSATGTNTVAPTMKVSVNAQTAVELTLATGSGGCTISAGGGGDYNMSFGNVNGLGVGTPSCGVVASVTANNATYATTYQITSAYSGFGTLSGPTIVETTPGFTNSSALTLGEGSSTAGPFIAIPASGSAVTINVTANDTPINRALAVTVSNANGASGFPGSGSGADSAIITFTLTVQ